MARNAAVDLTTTKANRAILLGVGGGAGIVLLARASGTPGVANLNQPTALLRIAIGTGGAILILMVIAEISPEVAIGFAALIGIGAFLTYGVDFARALSNGTLHPTIP